MRVGATPSASATDFTCRSISVSTAPSPVPPSRRPSILLRTTKHVSSAPPMGATCSLHSALSTGVIELSADTTKTIAAASGTRWNESSGSEASVLNPAVSRRVTPAARSGCGKLITA